MHDLASELDRGTVCVMLLHLAVDIGWPGGLVDRAHVRRWVERQQFRQQVVDFHVSADPGYPDAEAAS